MKSCKYKILWFETNACGGGLFLAYRTIKSQYYKKKKNYFPTTTLKILVPALIYQTRLHYLMTKKKSSISCAEF